MKTQPSTSWLLAGMLAILPLGATSVWAADKANQKALSSSDVDQISERIRHTGDQMREDLKKARARFEAQEAERKAAAERARVQAIKDKQHQQAQQAEQARQQKLAAQAKAERERQEAEQAKLQAERKKQAVLAAQTAKESEAADVQARKLKAAEALRKMRAATEPKAF